MSKQVITILRNVFLGVWFTTLLVASCVCLVYGDEILLYPRQVLVLLGLSIPTYLLLRSHGLNLQNTPLFIVIGVAAIIDITIIIMTVPSVYHTLPDSGFTTYNMYIKTCLCGNTILSICALYSLWRNRYSDEMQNA